MCFNNNANFPPKNQNKTKTPRKQNLCTEQGRIKHIYRIDKRKQKGRKRPLVPVYQPYYFRVPCTFPQISS